MLRQNGKIINITFLNMSEFLVVGVVMLAFYKLAELFVKRKERRAIIDKIDFSQGTNVNIERIIGQRDYDINKRSVLWGCLLIGVGLGVVLAYGIANWAGLYCKSVAMRDIHDQLTVIYTSCVLLFGGIGLFVSYFINKKEGTK